MFDLQRLHSTEVKILKEVHDTCIQLNIKYVILSGTLLGAIRHKGFIPWDDDIDIGMSRKDYEIFLKEGSNFLSSNLFIQHYSTEPETTFPFIKVMDTNTIFLEPATQSREIHHGIFIDIFPFDRVSSNWIKLRVEYKRKRLFYRLLQCYNTDNIEITSSIFKKTVGKIINRCYCKHFPISQFLKKEDERRKRLDSLGDNCYFLNQFSWNGTVTYQELFDSTLYSFEQSEFYGPKNFDAILVKYYGSNYMELPPVEDRKAHEPLMIVFDIEKEINEGGISECQTML